MKEIQDDEFRVIGQRDGTPNPGSHKGLRKWLPWAAAALALAVVVCLICFSGHGTDSAKEDEVVFDPIPEPVPAPTVVLPLSRADSSITRAYTERIDTVINDVALALYIPHNAVPGLAIGTPDIHDKRIVLVTQAADIRADNGRIAGAFVVDGKPLSWSLSKRGYCGIIDGRIAIGTADSSPLFEEAVEKGGSFFRQFPLVDNGQPVDNEPRGKAIRKALCDRNGEIFVAISDAPESFHDFAQALADLQVDNAIYLVGSDSYGFWRDASGHLTQLSLKRRGGYRYENYIRWMED